MTNLINDPGRAGIRAELEERLQAELARQHDEFLHGMDYIRRWSYTVDAGGTVPYTP
jgi:hypothetical protein